MTLSKPIHDTQVLIVDDTQAMRLIVQTILTAVGFPKPYQAADGAEALGIIADQQIDLLITDLAMDRIDGLELVHAVRRHPRPQIRNLPIVLLTGHASLRIVKAAAAAKVDRVLAKPVTPATLLEHVEAAMRAADSRGTGGLVAARIAAR
jgi:two-component system, chemotaxis family, chemotaxis protein CheY